MCESLGSVPAPLVTPVRAETKPEGEKKLKTSPVLVEGRWRRIRPVKGSEQIGPHSRGASLAACDQRCAQSTHARTRKMVNYAWAGRSQGKP